MRPVLPRALCSSLLAVGLLASCDESSEDVEFRELANLVGTPPMTDGNNDPADWPSYGHDLWNTRHNAVEPDHTHVTHPKIRWKRDLGGDITATPVVVGSTVYVGASNGLFAALSAADGTSVWTADLAGERINASAAVADGRVFVATTFGKLWALDQETGAALWTVDLADGNPNATLYGSPVQVDGIVYIGVSSVEAYPTGDPIAFQGSMVALDPDSGDVVWRTYLATGDQYGAGVWSTPAVQDGRLFFGTGQAYADPPSPYIDAMLALDTLTGAIEWFHSFWPDDVWVLLNPQGQDYDLGASPNIYWIGDRMVVGEGSKSGDYHVRDATDGSKVWSKRISNGGLIGGFIGSTAYANGRIYTVNNNLLGYNDFRLPLPPSGGKFAAFSAATGEMLQSRIMPPTYSSPCVAGGVVYYTDLIGTIWARHAVTGNVLWSLPTAETSGSGPSVSRGTLYVGTGVVSSLGAGGINPPALFHHLYAIDIDG